MAVETHKVEVVPIVLEPHPNADALSIVHVYNFTVVVRTEDWLNRATGAYIQPDSVVDVTRPEFSWLKKTPEDVRPQRIRVKKLRGIVSMGLLTQTPEGAQLGDDVAEILGVRHYDPEGELTAQGNVNTRRANPFAETEGPALVVPKYDVENIYRYATVFTPGELVHVTEKIDGMNTKFLYDSAKNKFFAGSRNFFLKEEASAIPWRIFHKYPWIGEFCAAHPDHVVFGETFGAVQSLKYGALPGEISFLAFDVFDLVNQGYWNTARLYSEINPANLVPLLAPMKFDFAELQKLADGPTLLSVVGNTNGLMKNGKQIPNIREGIVIRPELERYYRSLGRVQLKMVSNNYLEMAE